MKTFFKKIGNNIRESLTQLGTDIKIATRELSWRNIRGLAKDPVETRNYATVYMIFSGLLFLSTVYAAFNEFSGRERRPWKRWTNEYKATGLKIADSLRNAIETKNGETFRKRLAELEAAKARAKDSLRKYPAYVKLSDEYYKLATQLREFSKELADIKAYDSQDYYAYTEALKKNDFSTATKIKAKLDNYKVQIEGKTKQVEETRKKRDEKKVELDKYEKIINELETKIEALKGKLVAIETAKKAYNEKKVKVHQVIMRNYSTNNFGEYNMDVDRCQSCHAAWNDSLFSEKYYKGQFKEVTYEEFAEMHWKFHAPVSADEYQSKKPEEQKKILEEIAKHYKGKVKLAGNKLAIRKDPLQYHSPEIMKVHNIEKMGCTSCHAGQGRALKASHAHSRHGEPDYDHHWERPLVEGKFVEAGCQSCHSTAINLPMGETVSLGKKLVFDLGCNGCHALPNQEKYPVRKVGPNLAYVMKKDNPEFVYNWLLNPKDFYPHTKMPNFYLAETDARNITAFLSNLTDKDTTYKPLKYPGGGDVANGKNLTLQIGCTGCHSVDKIDWAAISKTPALREGAGFGPNLNKVGSKVNEDWLYDWLINPKHYYSETKMPSLRLTEQEASDITAYLMTLKKSDKQKLKPVDMAALKDANNIASGEKMVKMLGCYGCHNIREDINKLTNVSVSLTEEADKTSHEFDFGNTVRGDHYNIGHTWEGWIKGKIRDPRQYSTNRIPLMMPNFGLNETEVEAIAVAIKGWTNRKVSSQYQPHYDDITANYDAGQYFVRDNNCIGCHQIEDYKGAYIHQQIAEPTNRPPLLTHQGIKTQEDWLLKFFNNPKLDGHGIRPWIKVRMPSFQHSDEEWGYALRYFLAIKKKHINYQNYKNVPTTPEKVAMGKALFEKFQCVSCHYINGPSMEEQTKAGKLAPNLGMAYERLKPQYIHEWIGWPASLMPGVNMPNYFGEGYTMTAVPDSNLAKLGMDAKAMARYQGEAIRDYLFYMNSDMAMNTTKKAQPKKQQNKRNR